MDTQEVYAAFPTLPLGDAYVLRALRTDDAEDYLRCFSHPTLKKYIAEEDIPTTVPRAREEVQYWASLFPRKTSVYWGIALAVNDQLIGTCGFNFWNAQHGRAELSYDLDSAYWRQGVMSAALKTILRFGFKKMGLQRVQALVVPHNTPSIGLLQKLGFKREGTMREYKIINHRHEDAVIYALLRSYYDAVKQQW
jgi:ribosomal-protein-alanine N-acetyltransferase